MPHPYSFWLPWSVSSLPPEHTAEQSWYRDPVELLSFQFSPFVAGLTSEERLNAQVRLVFALGVAFAAFERVATVRSLIMLVVMLVVIHLSVEHVVLTEKKTHEEMVRRHEKEISVRHRNDEHLRHMEGRNVPRVASAAIHRHLPPQENRGTSLDSSFDPSVEHPMTATELISADQERYRQQHQFLRRQPTRFDVQNELMQVGGLPVRLPGTEYTPMRDQGNVHPNPGPYDFGTAVRSTNPLAYTFDVDYLERMYRPVDEIDQGLVTNPIPDPTFMARLPQFDTSFEDEGVQRWRDQFHSGMRFF